MIDKKLIGQFVDEWLQGKEYFLTDLSVDADDRIVVEIDHKDGVWIEDCVELSRFIEQHLDRDAEDFELEVGSAGIGQPFKVLRQYEIHEGDAVSVLTADGQRLKGRLGKLTGEEGFVLLTEEKQRPEGKKRPVTVEVARELRFTDVKETRLLIDFK